MSIHVLIERFTKEQMQSTLNHYNANKPADEFPLEQLDRAEGGFKIDLPPEKWARNWTSGLPPDANDKIRQLRWSNGYLKSSYYIGFTASQYMLLYEALVVGFGSGNVILE
jgi:hypothetical protein